ncbi:transcriptional regulator [Rubrobacter xylanophilus]|uniref:Transcriptional regulator n=1 Tax=Rubrobacter xylanophilus TaxID=49319 RepID=A0A510HM54_9ACTN|nr:FadR/GntR family transcriptional regulator [Rubrobacter xylanophilus]BBL81062.1 transcriptional regulator [Rubrobacter xylanophilus]
MTKGGSGREGVRAFRLSAGLADRLRRRILGGEFGPGGRLPGNRELAAAYGVGVGSVREAIRELDAEGLVEVRPGSGTYVSRDLRTSWPSGGERPLDREQVEELIEAREVLEPRLAELAARRASAEQVEGLWRALERMQESISDPPAFAEADVGLHMAIAEAVGNRFLMKATADIRALLRRDMELSAEVGIRRAGTLQFSVDSHRRLVAAIAAGEPEKAARIMSSILRRNRGFVTGLYSGGMAAEGSGEF